MKYEYFAILDTETNSLINHSIPESGLPVQVSMIITNLDMIPIKSINVYVKQRYMDPGSVAIHGLTSERLEQYGALEPQEAWDMIFNDDIEWDKVVGIAHNSSFDSKVLDRFSEQCGRYNPLVKYFDTLAYFRKNKDKNRKNNKLETITEYLGGDSEKIEKLSELVYKESTGYHDARFDAAALLYVVNSVKNDFIKFYSNQLY